MVVALGFDFTNGFHDTANAMATSIATRALRPKVALALAAVQFDGVISDVLIPAIIAPVLCGVLATVATFITYRLKARTRDEHADRGFRIGQIGSASLVSLAHGTNNAQKTMGVIWLDV